MKLQDALSVLAPNILAHLDVYRVGRPDQSPVLPQALWTSKEELEALRAVIDFAGQFGQVREILSDIHEEHGVTLDTINGANSKTPEWRKDKARVTGIMGLLYTFFHKD